MAVENMYVIVMIKAIIFDLNGVFITSPLLSDRFYSDFGIEPEIFLPALKEIMAKVRMPNAGSVYSYWKPYLGKWGVKLSQKEFEKYWFEAEEENGRLVDFAQELKNKGIKLFILSNNLRKRTEYYNAQFPFLTELFDKVYYSWQTGFIKPDERAYQLIFEENSLKPEECLYFDDSEYNVKVAQSLGINAHKFIDDNELIETINSSFA
jgi:HAD superfamily hydrolase (TIGR01509 family)